MKAGRDIAVGMGEFAAALGAQDRLTMILGSCVGIMIFDRERMVAAVLHAMLPEAPRPADSPARYVDTGLPLVLEAAIEAGARRRGLKAKIFGGANMFPKLTRTFLTHIGQRNAEAARLALASMGIEIVAEDLGGVTGRSASIDPASGVVEIRAGNQMRTI